MNKDKEYENLYAEIARNSQITAKVFLANVSVTAILIGYGLNTENPYVFLSPFAIILPSLFFVASQLESTTRIASYIRVFLETEETGIRWERRWFKMIKENKLPSYRKYVLAISHLYGLMGFACLFMFLLKWRSIFFNSNTLCCKLVEIGIVVLPILSILIYGVFLVFRSLV
ncbi:MAG: hypothetical protein JEZ14_26345 [Marinilabiliaceae bacterium]|nr:hypothetical protein [Marinilabiliaceae bacterium]